MSRLSLTTAGDWVAEPHRRNNNFCCKRKVWKVTFKEKNVPCLGSNENVMCQMLLQTYQIPTSFWRWPSLIRKAVLKSDTSSGFREEIAAYKCCLWFGPLGNNTGNPLLAIRNQGKAACKGACFFCWPSGLEPTWEHCVHIACTKSDLYMMYLFNIYHFSM